MTALDPGIYNRMRNTIDDFTSAAHVLVQQLDEALKGPALPDEPALQSLRNRIALLGYQLDQADPLGEVQAETWGVANLDAARTELSP